jgi:hypothetical protein
MMEEQRSSRYKGYEPQRRGRAPSREIRAGGALVDHVLPSRVRLWPRRRARYLGLNEVTHSKSFAIPGFIKDVALSFGADRETENQNFAAEKKEVVGGLQFQFDLPRGSPISAFTLTRNGITALFPEPSTPT